MTDKAVVLMYYGFPEREEEMVEYLKDILHGKTPPDGLVRENIQKLRMIGGASPSGRIVTSIRKKVEEKLHDHGYRVYLLSKHYRPSLKDAGKIVDGEVVFEIPLFPIYSDFIFRSYFEVLEDRLQGRQFIRIFNIGFEEPLMSYYRGMVRGMKITCWFFLHTASLWNIPMNIQLTWKDYPPSSQPEGNM